MCTTRFLLIILIMHIKLNKCCSVLKCLQYRKQRVIILGSFLSSRIYKFLNYLPKSCFGIKIKKISVVFFFYFIFLVIRGCNIFYNFVSKFRKYVQPVISRQISILCYYITYINIWGGAWFPKMQTYIQQRKRVQTMRCQYVNCHIEN